VAEFDQPNPEAGMVALPYPHGAGQHASADREQRANVQFPRKNAGRAPGRPGRALGVGEAGPGMRQGRPPGRGQPDGTGQPFKQWPAQLAFQGLDLVGQPRLADPQSLGGRGEGTFIDDGHEVLKLAQRNCHA
jgi:hypothetical protein